MSTTTKDNDGAGIRFCKLCNKPIMSESAYKRHVNYCRRTLTKPKKRKRSCKSCHIAKAKCSFESPCTRCVSKGLFCEYEKPQASTPGNESSGEAQDATMSEGSEGSVGTSADEFMVEVNPLLPPSYTPTIQPPRTAMELREDLTQQASIAIILEVMQGLPLMMTNMETLPRIIHRPSMETNLPEAISKCMQISQLFMHRNSSPHGRAMYLSVLNEEIARLVHVHPNASQPDLMAGLQVLQIYATMTALDSEASRTNQAPEMQDEYSFYLMQVYNRQLFTYDNYSPFDIDNIGHDNETWEEFIYAETRRRAGLFWFLQSRVLNINRAFVSPPVMGYRGLALPAPESLWMAKTREEWQAARARIRTRGIQHGPYGTSMRTLGDLIDAQHAPPDSYYAEQRRQWLATSGKDEVLLLIGASMI
ncbi:hypothetical protein GGR57DRAFT_61941 [Xylariaceae sp. FL1272]|nr:hypothetical protein GGR57DRAFT_61941 [Xylariaceae sp. FL1272]